MNHVYRLIWREAAGGFVAVAEMVRACGARTSTKAAAVLSSALLGMAGAHAAGTGFNVVEGSATLNTSGTTTTIHQTTHGVRIDWQTLGVAANETLTFVQPSANAVALNVITGGVATQILGQLNANGNVFILNPNGVLVGAGAQVSVGGFMASTADLASFNASTGGVVLQANSSTAEVRNAGKIIATEGGMVALVGNKVINSGTIVAPGGGIYLLGGGRVEFKPGDGSPFTYSLTTDSANAKSVINTGKLSAAGGQIAMDARSTKQAVVNASGVIEAGTATQGADGSVRLSALGGAGQINVYGSVTAGTTGSVTASLDAGGTLTKVVGDPNEAVPTLPANNTWLSAQDKVYDGTTAVSVDVDMAQLSAANYFAFKLTSASFASRNAATDATVNVAGTINQSWGAHFNLPATLKADIAKAQLTITTADVVKTYDGTTSANGSALASGLVSSDSVSGGSFAYANKNAGSGKTVTVSGVTVNDGNNGNNYDVSYVANTTSTIDKAALTITSTDVTKTYDGGTSAAGTAVAGAQTSLKGTDTLAGGSFAYTDKNAGSGKTVTVSGVTVNDGNNGNNYDVSYVANTTSTINKAALTITSTDVTKTYDGGTSAAGTAVAGAQTSLKGTDTLVGGSFAYANKNAGSGKTVTVSGVTVNDGNNGNNYDVSYVANTTSTIDKAQLTLSAVADTKAFDGTTTSTGAPQVAGLVASDSIASLSQSFDSSAVGARTLNVNGYVLNDGNGGNNYSVTLASASGAITNPPVTNPPTTPPDLGNVINNGGTQPTQINVDLAGLGDLLSQLPATAAGEEDDPEKIKARRRSDRSPLRVTDGGVKAPPALR